MVKTVLKSMGAAGAVLLFLIPVVVMFWALTERILAK